MKCKKSSGNVFKDLGLKNADELIKKSEVKMVKKNKPKSKSQQAREFIIAHPGKNYDECVKLGMTDIKKQTFYDSTYKVRQMKKDGSIESTNNSRYKNPELINVIETYMSENPDGTYKTFLNTTKLACTQNLFQYHRRRLRKEAGQETSTRKKEKQLQLWLFGIPTEGQTQESIDFAKSCITKLDEVLKLKLRMRGLTDPDEIGIWSLKSV